jgi:hypothetical protein
MKNKLKVIVVGDYITDIYELAIYNSLISLGVEGFRFAISEYFDEAIKLDRKISFGPRELWLRCQKRYRMGPVLNRLNKDLVSLARSIRPDVIFVYRSPYVFGSTLSKVRKWAKAVFVYNNDDPFSPSYPSYFWRHHFDGLPYCDHIFCFRTKNLSDYSSIGFKNTSLFLPYYVKGKHFFIRSKVKNSFTSDVMFAGHFEPDGRDELLKRIVEKGIDFRLYGTEWSDSCLYDYFATKFGEIVPLRNDYNLALNSTQIALAFLSKKNFDSLTTRTFEIPATRTFMLGEFSEECNEIFKEGVEAEYFRDGNELIDKISFYLRKDRVRDRIAVAGNRKLHRVGHEATDRARQLLDTYSRL